jgi:hypothetical protein
VTKKIISRDGSIRNRPREGKLDVKPQGCPAVLKIDSPYRIAPWAKAS